MKSAWKIAQGVVLSAIEDHKRTGADRLVPELPFTGKSRRH
jgi:hypothetical protein